VGVGIGNTLKEYHTIDKERIAESVSLSYIFDALTSLFRKDVVAFPTLVADAKYPEVICDGLRHVCLPDSVANDVQLGGASKPNSMIITGPNAGGKSTFVKALFTNIVLAQAFGVTTCSQMQLTPFEHISTQMNVPDSNGKESLFQAEMNRCKQKLDLAKAGGFTAIALDEIFSSTEPVEGIAAAYAVAKRIGSYANVMAVVSTHYHYLTNLAKVEDYENYRMTCTDELEFSYTLEKGVSERHIALDLMKQSGFDARLIDSAMRIRDKVCLFSEKENVENV
jgi:DNA mismatch repair protein MutS